MHFPENVNAETNRAFIVFSHIYIYIYMKYFFPGVPVASIFCISNVKCEKEMSSAIVETHTICKFSPIPYLLNCLLMSAVLLFVCILVA